MTPHPRLVFHDWEFIDTGDTIIPISVGMIDDAGNELLLFNWHCDLNHVANDDWLAANVLPHLPAHYVDATEDWGWDLDDSRVQTPTELADSVLHFLKPEDRPLELWGHYPMYDHVVLMWLWDRARDRPTGMPLRTSCTQQAWTMLGKPDGVKPIDGPKAHDALADANWIRGFHANLRTHASIYHSDLVI